MPFIKIWLHTVWTTKNREPYLKPTIRNNVFKHIRSNASKNGIYIDFINGYHDHVHCLISLNATQSIAEVIKNIKGESSFWINKNQLLDEIFNWQTEYYAASISKKEIDSTRNYIKNQEEHHQKQLLDEELKIMVKEYGLERFR